MKDEVIEAARKRIGDFLKKNREEQGLTKYSVTKTAGWYNSIFIDKIENGQPYNIDTLLRYLQATNMYIFFAQKDKSDDTRPLDEDDIFNAIKKEDRDGL